MSGMTLNISADQIMQRAARQLFKSVNSRVMEPSRVKYCPKNTGNLASTGEVLEPVIVGRVVTVTAQYTAPYAIYVHERNLKYKNGTWKYLSTPANEGIMQIMDDVGTDALEGLRQ